MTDLTYGDVVTMLRDAYARGPSALLRRVAEAGHSPQHVQNIMRVGRLNLRTLLWLAPLAGLDVIVRRRVGAAVVAGPGHREGG